MALDPRSASAARRLAYNLISLRRYPEAEASQARAMALAPSDLATIQQSADMALTTVQIDGLGYIPDHFELT